MADGTTVNELKALVAHRLGKQGKDAKFMGFSRDVWRLNLMLDE
jgi:hypothetical protein